MLPLHHLRTYTLTHAHNTITPMGDSGERPTTHNTSNAHMCAAQPQRTSRTPTSDRIERYASIPPFADIHPARTQHDHTHGRLGREAHHTQHKQRTHVRQPHGKNRTPFSSIQRRWISIILRADTTRVMCKSTCHCVGEQARWGA